MPPHIGRAPAPFDRVAPDPTRYIAAEVTARRDLAPDLWTFRVRPAEPLRFTPGQYVAVAVPAAGRMIERPYSICSAPHEPELEFFVELVPNGALTPRLYDLGVGAKVYVRRAAKGRFVFDADRANHLMIASVTGVAPYVSMVRSGQARGRLLILHAASTPVELGYSEELAAVPWLEYVRTVSRPWLFPDWPGERGRAEDVLRKYADTRGLQPGDTTVYACGNPQMIRNVQGVVERAGFPRAAFREEMFWPPGHPLAA
jgi:ferredoxin/flavodoxin---NADP+ reductase